MSRTTAIVCNRCGSPCIEGNSLIEATGGPLRARLPGPTDLCGSCSDRLIDFIRSGDPQQQPIRHLEPIAAGAPRGEWESGKPEATTTF